MADPTLSPVYTGNNCYIQVQPNGGQPVDIALCQHITVSRMVSRRPVQQINTPFWVDQPVGAVGATVSVTNMVGLNGGFPSLGLTPGASLSEALSQPFATFTVVDENGKAVCRVINSAFTQDSLDVTANDPLAYSGSWNAQDAMLI